MATPSRRPAIQAATSGFLGVAAGLGAGHLVAGLVLDPSASPLLAVGDAAIDRTPAAVKNFAIERFGTHDKTALLVGMTGVLALTGMGIGLISVRRRWPGVVAIIGVGAIGIAAVHEQSGTALGLLAPVAAVLVGVAVYCWRYPRPPRDEQDVSATAPALERRRFLQGSLATGVGAAAASLGGFALFGRVDVEGSRRALGALVPTKPAPPIPPNAAFPDVGTPTFMTPSPDFYRVDINVVVPRIRAEDAMLRITGMVDRPMEFRFAEIRRMPLVEKTITMACVSNPVGGPYVSTANFVGVPLMDLLKQAGVRPGATQVVGHSIDGSTLGTPLQMIREAGDDALLVIGMNREPLLPEHGFPMRTVVAGLYGYVSATKWVHELELATYDVEPYWVERGWDGRPPGLAPIKISARIDAPEPFARVSAAPGGEVTVAGTAWAPGRGISRVEVRIDDGDWEPADLSAKVNPNTWRMFRITKSLPRGQHAVTCRAIDGAGAMQSEQRLDPLSPGPAPDGASGWHSIVFSVD